MIDANAVRTMEMEAALDALREHFNITRKAKP